MTEITVSRDDETATVTISNPERMNALSTSACETMAESLRTLAHDRSVRCVVVTGSGEAFCSGIDLAGGAGAGGPAAELEGGLNAIATSLLRMEKPTVASVSGPAIGAGASIATACDFVYAATSAEFGWGFTDIGLAPDTGATYVLPRLVGVRRAMELLTTGRRISAEEAVDLGVATEAIPDPQLDEVVNQRVEMLRSRPTRAVGEAKRLLLRNTHRSLEEALAAETRAQKRMVTTDDFSEGIQAFAEQRDPEFTGR
ncbi:enoyl-CoA hydratase/isomerase family protein [Halocatena salina]|uniref:Enoyl-CoA hydratase-related protein n=1 Tax=Halocatena salina TaxID=2934340 RepID=A0A8U0A1K7_9EURY|nr:enoyl-CoA hydratase-related protein [Halocatena salina]UPM42952.1 enoyl-CoA hydratase-related protein [Halocatena salina]